MYHALRTKLIGLLSRLYFNIPIGILGVKDVFFRYGEGVAKRGDELREQILWSAKDMLLELGFDRTSMDMVASRANTTKRSVYAHFGNKEKLFVAVIERVRSLLLLRLRQPQDYAADPGEALTMFCGRYLEILLHKGSVQLCRLSMGESERFREQAVRCFDMLFGEVVRVLEGYLAEKFSLPPSVAHEHADRLIGLVLHPRFSRALFGVDPIAGGFDPQHLSPSFDLAPVSAAVADLLNALRPNDGR